MIILDEHPHHYYYHHVLILLCNNYSKLTSLVIVVFIIKSLSFLMILFEEAFYLLTYLFIYLYICLGNIVFVSVYVSDVLECSKQKIFKRNKKSTNSKSQQM